MKPLAHTLGEFALKCESVPPGEHNRVVRARLTPLGLQIEARAKPSAASQVVWSQYLVPWALFEPDATNVPADDLLGMHLETVLRLLELEVKRGRSREL